MNYPETRSISEKSAKKIKKAKLTISQKGKKESKANMQLYHKKKINRTT
jgi:hypothetical protein